MVAAAGRWPVEEEAEDGDANRPATQLGRERLRPSRHCGTAKTPEEPLVAVAQERSISNIGLTGCRRKLQLAEINTDFIAAYPSPRPGHD